MTTGTTRRAHWETVYATEREDEVSWFEASPEISLELIQATGVARSASIIDIGGGASRLIDALVDTGYSTVSVLDLSETALSRAREPLGGRAKDVTWIAADVTSWHPAPDAYDVWHDRAAFHFLVEASDRSAYVERLAYALRPGGHVIIGTFALDGPERCSGLPVMRYDAALLGRTLGPSFALVETRRHDHLTPGGRRQAFQFGRFQRSPIAAT